MLNKIDQQTSPITFSPKRSLADLIQQQGKKLSLEVETKKSDSPRLDRKSESPRVELESPAIERFDLGLSQE